MKDGIIYLLRCTISDKKYIGRTVCGLRRRFKDHFSYVASHPEAHYKLANEIRKHGKENFEISEVEKCSGADLSERERFWIAKLDTFENGLNSTDGGEIYRMNDEARLRLIERMRARRGSKNPMYGKARPSDVRAAISSKLSGRVLSEDTKQKMSEAQTGEKNYNYGKTYSPERCAQISDALRLAYEEGRKITSHSDGVRLGKSNIGRKLSEEHKAKIASKLRGKPKSDDHKKALRKPHKKCQ